jgi:hypothetical protein
LIGLNVGQGNGLQSFLFKIEMNGVHV